MSHIRIAKDPADIHASGWRPPAPTCAGRRHRGGGQQEGAGWRQVRRDRHGGQHRRDDAGEFTRDTEFSLPTERLRRAITAAAGDERCHFVNASRLATALLGQSLGANMFMLGYAYQIARCRSRCGGRAGTRAQRRGRRDEHRGRSAGAAVPRSTRRGREAGRSDGSPATTLSGSFDEIGRTARRVPDRLPNAAYAARYRAWVDKATVAEARLAPGKCGLARGRRALPVQADGYKTNTRWRGSIRWAPSPAGQGHLDGEFAASLL